MGASRKLSNATPITKKGPTKTGDKKIKRHKKVETFSSYIFKAFFPVGIFLLVYVSKLLSKLLEGISFITISFGAALSSTKFLSLSDVFLLFGICLNSYNYNEAKFVILNKT